MCPFHNFSPGQHDPGERWGRRTRFWVGFTFSFSELWDFWIKKESGNFCDPIWICDWLPCRIGFGSKLIYLENALFIFYLGSRDSWGMRNALNYLLTQFKIFLNTNNCSMMVELHFLKCSIIWSQLECYSQKCFEQQIHVI